MLCMTPLMAQVLSRAQFLEVDLTYQVSHEFTYLMNVVTFHTPTLQCKLSLPVTNVGIISEGPVLSSFQYKDGCGSCIHGFT